MSKLEQILGVSLGLLIIGSPVWFYLAMLAYEASPYAKEKDTRREFASVIEDLSSFCMGPPEGYPRLQGGSVVSFTNRFEPIEGIDVERQIADHVGRCIANDSARSALITSIASKNMAVEREALEKLKSYPDYVFNFRSGRNGSVSKPQPVTFAVESEEGLYEKGASSIFVCPENTRLILGVVIFGDECAQLSHIPKNIDFLILSELCSNRCKLEGRLYEDGTIAELSLGSLTTSPADMDSALLFWDGVLSEKIEQTRKEIEKIEPKSPEVWQELLDLSGLK